MVINTEPGLLPSFQVPMQSSNRLLRKALSQTSTLFSPPQYTSLRRDQHLPIMSIIPSHQIPTVESLYAQGKLASPSDKIKFSHDTSFNRKIGLIRGDITKLKVHAIVNAANKSLLGGGGVDGAIHRAAGPELLAECRTLNGCNTGQAKITDGYRLPASKIIHTVGPVYHEWEGRGAAEMLRTCYRNCLDVARENGCRQIVFNCISTGVYGFPSMLAAKYACQAVREWLRDTSSPRGIDQIVFCTFEQKDVDAYNRFIPWVSLSLLLNPPTNSLPVFTSLPKGLREMMRRNSRRRTSLELFFHIKDEHNILIRDSWSLFFWMGVAILILPITRLLLATTWAWRVHNSQSLQLSLSLVDH